MITLKTLHEATAQQVFDQAVTHLRTQGKRAVIHSNIGGSRCRYRTSSGLKCAAGCFIADDEYDPEMEGRSFTSVLFPDTINKNLICELQTVHDNFPPEDWEQQFERVAKQFNLIYK
jgi:hypothetical protein